MTIEPNNEAPSTPVPVTPLESPGKLLREGREAKGMSEQEVATNLNLRVTLIKEIEQDKFDARTASTFTRGYLKTYAKLVGVSEDRVVAGYEQLVGTHEVQYAEMYSFSRRTKLEANENRLRTFSWIFCILLAAGLFYWFWSQPAEKPALVKLDESQLPASAATATQGDSEQAMPVAEQGTPESQEVAPQGADVNAAPATEAQSTAAVASAAVTTVTEPSAAQPAPAAPVTSSAVTTEVAVSAVTQPASAAEAVAQDLVISFAGDCWIKVVDASGKVLVEGLRRGGSESRLDGKPPFKLTVGAIKYVSISYMGEAVNTKQFPVGRVARFTLPLKS